MAHFAKLDENNIVLQVNVVGNSTIGDLPYPESESVGIEFLTQWSGGHTNWKQTSYNNNFRVRYAGIGFKYDAALDAFIPPQPYPSWILGNDLDWHSPTPYPTDNNFYVWNETTQLWDLVDPTSV